MVVPCGTLSKNRLLKEDSMKITIISVGKLKEKYLKQGIQEYLKRLSSYANVNIVEVADEKAPETLSDAEMETVKRKEGERILSNIQPDTLCIYA